MMIDVLELNTAKSYLTFTQPYTDTHVCCGESWSDQGGPAESSARRGGCEAVRDEAAAAARLGGSDLVY